MKKFIRIIGIPVIALMTTLFLTSCPGPEPPGPDGPDEPTSEGVYLGIIGFNQNLMSKDIKLLNNKSWKEFRTFIDGLQMEKGTGLYYADYSAIDKLKSYGEPPQLSTVALVTFTDGLDNVSLVDESTNPENYDSKEAYAKGLNDRIKSEYVHGKKISAYTIGIKGTDVTNDTEFYNNLNMLSSSSENVYEASDMNEALEQFEQIAKSLYSSTTTSTLKLDIPGGYDNNIRIRFTFDNVTSADNSSKYIECSYVRSENGRRLEDITYHGMKGSGTALSSVSKNGAYYVFEFRGLTDANGNAISQNDISNLRLWTQISSGLWQPDVEFTPDTSSKVTEEKSSALIMLVLDCTTSLGDQFSNMKYAARSFVETLLTTTSSSGGGDDANGHGYVDLGLPSGLLWATCNVGANKPEDYGNYYAWGETSPKSTYTDGNSVTYGKNLSDISGNSQYDAARANWGEGWRMPTKAEMEELKNKCTWKWTTQNGVKGYKVTGSNGNSIFLPAAGYRDGSSLYFAGSYGIYWSSTPRESGSNRAWYLLFGSSGFDMYGNRRGGGLSVRPVIE